MYEHKKQPLAPLPVFYRRVVKSLLLAGAILAFCLLVGLVGFHQLAKAAWIDALHNAAMLLSGMGPVIFPDSTGGKIFSSCYALFSGVVFITNIGLILAPAIHRIFHKFHLEDDATL